MVSEKPDIEIAGNLRDRLKLRRLKPLNLGRV